jgi:hypothetical protein
MRKYQVICMSFDGEYLGLKLCNNPDLQSALGVLGADSVEFYDCR